MGAVNFSLDPRLVTALQSELPLRVLIETGTFKGDTVAELEPYFDKVVSIELSEALWADAVKRFEPHPHVQILRGNSPDRLRELRSELQNVGALYWLDAHWCVATDTAGELSQCPLLEELQAIGRLNSQSVILIDDARLFLATPPAPHEVSQWPSFYEVLAALRALSDSHALMVVNDCILFYPAGIDGVVKKYAHYYGADWLTVFNTFRDHEHLAIRLKEKERELESVKVKEQEIFFLKADCNTKDEEINAKDEEIKSLKYDCNTKDEEIQSLKKICEEREIVIFQLDHRVKFLERTNIPGRVLLKLRSVLIQALPVVKRRVMSLLCPLLALKRRVVLIITPRLGVLRQHAPRPLSIPKRYANSVNPNRMPKISIVTPSYNQAIYLERTIRSVIEQGYPNLEYVVQDGGSKDGSVEILERYSDRLTFWESKRDEGQTNAINLGFRHVSGEIMAYLNSDDLLLPGAITHVASYFEKHPEVDVVYGHRIIIDENDHEIGRWILPAHDDKVLSWVDFVPQETMFWRRRIWDNIGGSLDESFHFAMDWDLLLRFRDAGAKFVRLPDFLAAFRVHPQQKTSAQITDIGFKEMSRLRQRCHGREVHNADIRRGAASYMLRHVVVSLIYRGKTRLRRKQ